MKLACFLAQGEERYGIVEGGNLREVRGSIFGELAPTGKSFLLAEVKLLAPCRPSKILALALNYQSHLGERTASAHPEVFLKPPSAVIGPEEPIVIPRDAGRVDHEGELVVIMKKRAKDVSLEEALDYVLGYTCGNDVSARDWQRNDRQWWRAKGSDTFAPLGPWIATELDPSDLKLEVRLNGEVVQSTTTALLIHNIPHIISFASRVVTLEPGDAIFTGTPGTTQPMKAGDVVEVEIEGIGLLRNPVAAEAQ